MVPRDLAKRFHLLPLDFDKTKNQLVLAISDVNEIVGPRSSPHASSRGRGH